MTTQWRIVNGRWQEVPTRFTRRTEYHLKAIGATACILATVAIAGYGETRGHEDINALPPIPAQAETLQVETVLVPPEPTERLIEATKPVPTGTVREVSAYTSTVAQTDATPCISADGSDICVRYAAGEGICATNAYPMGTVLSVDGLGTCVVADRMNARYRNRVDWYFGQDTPRAIEFGIQNLYVEVQ